MTYHMLHNLNCNYRASPIPNAMSTPSCATNSPALGRPHLAVNHVIPNLVDKRNGAVVVKPARALHQQFETVHNVRVASATAGMCYAVPRRPRMG